MSTDRSHILDQLAAGEITAEEAARLLQQANTASNAFSKDSPHTPARDIANGGRLRVRVTNLDTGRDRVNVQLPISLFEAGLRLGARCEPEIAGLNVGEIFDQIRAGAGGKIVEVENWEDGERVEVYIE